MEVAASGVEEFLIEFPPRLLAAPDIDGLTGTLHLHAVDGLSRWSIDLDARADACAARGQAEADTEVRGTESDLLLWLTNRVTADTLEVTGRCDVVAAWSQLRR